jgi:hypothetical protein
MALLLWASVNLDFMGRRLVGIASRDESRCAHSDNDRSAEGLGGTGHDPTVGRIGKANEMHLKQATSPTTILWSH